MNQTYKKPPILIWLMSDMIKIVIKYLLEFQLKTIIYKMVFKINIKGIPIPNGFLITPIYNNENPCTGVPFDA